MLPRLRQSTQNRGGVRSLLRIEISRGISWGQTLRMNFVGTDPSDVNFATEVLPLVEKNPGLRSKDLAALVGKSIPTISRFLKGLKDNGKIKFRGAPKNGGYFAK